MKRFISQLLFFIALLAMLAGYQTDLLAQNFMKYHTWATEKYQDPGLDTFYRRLDFRSTDVVLTSVGSYYGATENDVRIPEIALFINKLRQDIPTLHIYTVESRGFRIMNPRINYKDGAVVNAQEGLQLDSRGNTINGEVAGNHPYTTHPTIQRFRDDNNNFGNITNYPIKFILSGNFAGDNKDELALLQDSGGIQRIVLLRNNFADEILGYTFVTSFQDYIYRGNSAILNFQNLKYAIAGDFDNDFRSEIIMFWKTTGGYNKIEKFYHNGTNWNIVNVAANSGMNFDNLKGVTKGDFNGDGIEEIACAYHNPSGPQLINIFYNNNYTSYTTVYNRNTSFLDFSKIKHIAAGNYKDSLTIGGNEIDEIALFCDHGTGSEIYGLESVQAIYVTDHNPTNWYYVPVVKEHRTNMSFTNDKAKFIFSANFDRDVRNRDDLGMYYFGTDNDGQTEFKKILMWINEPDFTANDFTVDTTNPTTEQRNKFFPIALNALRLQTDMSVTNLRVGYPDGFIRIHPATYINTIKKYFNTIAVGREDYTDMFDREGTRSNEEEEDNGFPNRNITEGIYDYWQDYLSAFRSYLDLAASHNFKVMNIMAMSSVNNYDDIRVEPENDRFWVGFNEFDNLLNLPTYFRDNLTDQIINNHRAFLGWSIDDEPDGYEEQGNPEGWQYDYKDHFVRDAYATFDTPPRRPNPNERIGRANDLLGNYYDRIKEATEKPVHLNFHANELDYDYFHNSYDITSYDDYRYGPEKTLVPLEIYWENSKAQYKSLVKYNKTSGFVWLQGIGYESINHGQHAGTPDFAAQRYMLFENAIEGMRGILYHGLQPMLVNDTLHGPIMLALSEFKNYMPIFYKENLNNLVSTNYDRRVGADKVDDGFGYDINSNLSYSFHYDTTNSIYYLFVTNTQSYNDLNDVSYTCFVNPNTSNQVYLLSPEYFSTGAYDIITSDKHTQGSYINFEDNIKKFEVKIYAIGGLPNWKRTLADSIGMRGTLAFSNQNKLVAYPDTLVTQRSIAYDTVRYHSVYQRTLPDGRNGIFYRRSHRMTIDMPQDIIDWEPQEYFVSERFGYEGFPPIDVITDCMNPSIVVRFDTTVGFPRVYIVYTCKNDQASYQNNYNYVVENILLANIDYPNPQAFPPITGKIIGQAWGRDMNKWGTPVINASYPGNYYAWSDSSRGIVVGFKQPDQSTFSVGNTFSVKWNRNNTLSEATHPSLNVYSRIWLYEDDCALVWQEGMRDNPALSHIYYTRIRKNFRSNQILFNYLTSNRCDNWRFFGLLNPANNIVRLFNPGIGSPQDTLLYLENKFPVVYRTNGMDTRGAYTLPEHHFDKIYWESKFIDGSRVIALSPIRHTDIWNDPLQTWVPDCMSIEDLSRIRSPYCNVIQPNVSQGCMGQYSGLYNEHSDSSIVLDFVAQSFSDPSDTRIWQINHGYWTLFNAHDTLTTNFMNYTKAYPFIGKGKYPHLAAMPSMSGRIEWQHNRRLYETYRGTPPEIASSIYLFARQKFEDPEASYPFFGFSKNGHDLMVTPIWLTDGYGEDIIPKINVRDYNSENLRARDTIYTDWFTLESINDLHFLAYGKKQNQFGIYLQRRSNNQIFNLRCRSNNDSVFSFHKFKLINGTNDEFRVLWVKKNADDFYTEEIVIGGLPNIRELNEGNDSSFYSRSIIDTHEEILDLGSGSYNNNTENLEVTVFPNPADKIIYATAYLPQSDLNNNNKTTRNLVLRVYSNAGSELFMQEVKPGETISIPTNQLTQGAYFIRAEEKADSWDNPLPPVMKSFIIER